MVESILRATVEEGGKGMVASIVSGLTETVSGLLGGLGKGIAGLFNDLFVAEAGGLTDMATWVIVLLGVSIGLGAIGWVSSLIRNRR